MLRIVKEYPHGWGATNSPPSDILVSRDTSWFVHGFDYFWPEFSRNALEVFNRAVEDSGLMVEYMRGVSGYKTDYDLNINDDTPLHVIAMLHHYNATLDDDWVREHIALVIKLTDYMLTQRDEHGLVFCACQRRRPVRHLVVAQHHSLLHARRRRYRDQCRGGLRARGGGDALRRRRRPRALGTLQRRGAARCARR